MRISEKKTIEKEEEFNIEYLCDWCNEKIQHATSDERNKFTLESYIAETFSFYGSYGIKRWVDLCHDCVEKLFTLLKEKGVQIQSEDWNC